MPESFTQLAGERPTLAMPQAVLDQIVEHVSANASIEQCGLLLGWSVGGLTHVAIHEACTNNASEPTRRYVIAARAYLEAERRGRRLGLDVVGVYHSHLDGEPRPSLIDEKLAWPNMAYLIVALGAPSLTATAWSLDGKGPDRRLTPMWLRCS